MGKCLIFFQRLSTTSQIFDIIWWKQREQRITTMIGRQKEQIELLRALNSKQSEFVALYGRRRIGKTFLVNEFFCGQFAFRATGIEGGSKREQLDLFREELRRHGLAKCRKLPSWIAAFARLSELLEASDATKKVVFFDELPWFDTPCAGFLRAFEAFWNGWASARNDILLVVCGSATTWMLNKMLRARGGLHNRVTVQLPIAPFTLKECEEYVASRNLALDRRQIAECYMAMGGVAYYWTLLREGESAAQSFDRLFFGDSAVMRDEFRRLFSSLFKMERRHVDVVKALGEKKSGMTRGELLEALGEKSNGDVSQCLTELVECGFLRRYSQPAKVKRDAIYQLVDNYTLFYFKFLDGWKGNDQQFWTHNYLSPRLNAWRGVSFERICFWHIPQIKAALGISGIGADVYSWRGNDSDGHGAQIDMLIDRADNTISVCEMKYFQDEFEITSEEAERIRHRGVTFANATRSRKAIQNVLVSNSKYSGIIHRVVTLDDLFKE